ncbi:hypothetical protein EJB05_48291, partial [Eragrostis curvula]
MVVLMEEFGGLSLKRKGADEPQLFDVGGDDRSVFPISCRATKMRRLACSDGPAAGGVGAAEQQVDLPMGDAAAPSPVPSAGGEHERAVVLYGGDAAQSAPQLRPCGAHVRAGAAYWLRAMLREADSRTVRDLLSGAQEQGAADLALALVPWVPPPPAAEEEAEPSAVAEAVDGGDSDGAAAMDVEEEDDDHQVKQWARQAFGGAGCGEGYAYRWPQHCMAPPQLPAVGQASPVMWSW